MHKWHVTITESGTNGKTQFGGFTGPALPHEAIDRIVKRHYGREAFFSTGHNGEKGRKDVGGILRKAAGQSWDVLCPRVCVTVVRDGVVIL